jgi:hypothetical protein
MDQRRRRTDGGKPGISIVLLDSVLRSYPGWQITDRPFRDANNVHCGQFAFHAYPFAELAF